VIEICPSIFNYYDLAYLIFLLENYSIMKVIAVVNCDIGKESKHIPSKGQELFWLEEK
jgi:hypothetical protein